jgi:hypothetical protein
VVRLTTRYGAQSAPLEVRLDPRLQDTVTAGDIAAHWELSNKVNEDIEALHRTVNQIRASREALAKVQRPTPTGRQSRALNAAADFDRRMSAIEEQLLQVNMKASEDNLRYPNRLNEQYDTFSVTLDDQDVRPTEPQQQVFAELHRRLAEQLAKWKSLRKAELPLLNEELLHAGDSPLTVPSGD